MRVASGGRHADGAERSRRRRIRNPRQERVPTGPPAGIPALVLGFPSIVATSTQFGRRGRLRGALPQGTRRRPPGRLPAAPATPGAVGVAGGGPGTPPSTSGAHGFAAPTDTAKGAERNDPRPEIERERTCPTRARERARALGRPAADGRVFRPGELDLSHKVILTRRHHRELRWLPASANKLSRPSTPASRVLHHRSQRRRRPP